jgi:hypothetical protein
VVLVCFAIVELCWAQGSDPQTLAVLALLTLPRFYFHSHAATLDVPVAAMYVLAAALVVYPRSRPLRSLYCVASAVAALDNGDLGLATSQLERALAQGVEHQDSRTPTRGFAQGAVL